LASSSILTRLTKRDALGALERVVQGRLVAERAANPALAAMKSLAGAIS
jgi:hypothetical protein